VSLPALFKHLSVGEMAAVFCLGALAVTWLGVFLCRGVANEWIHGRRSANEMIGLTLAAFSTLYGILLGLLAVEAYQDFSSVKDIVFRRRRRRLRLASRLGRLPATDSGQPIEGVAGLRSRSD
jgi:hypothetical protein